jgi:hypothetical protein
MVLVITKVKRWMLIAESARPASVTKATNDYEDVMVLLSWLAERKVGINFAEYREKPKSQLLPGFQLLYTKHPSVRGLLKETMGHEDFAFITSESR